MTVQSNWVLQLEKQNHLYVSPWKMLPRRHGVSLTAGRKEEGVTNKKLVPVTGAVLTKNKQADGRESHCNPPALKESLKLFFIIVWPLIPHLWGRILLDLTGWRRQEEGEADCLTDFKKHYEFYLICHQAVLTASFSFLLFEKALNI